MRRPMILLLALLLIVASPAAAQIVVSPPTVLNSPTIDSPTITGTVTGTPTWASAQTFPGLTVSGSANVNSLCLDATNQDTCLVRDAVRTFGVRDGGTEASPVTPIIRLYKFYVSDTDYSRIYMQYVTGTDTFNFLTEASGTGTRAGVKVNGWSFLANNNLDPGADDGYSIGGGNRPATIIASSLYTLGSSANGAKMGWTRATTTVSTVNLAATITATNLIPAGSVVYHCSTRNTAAFNGTMTSFDIGDGSTANLFANDAALTSGSTTNLVNHLSTFKPTLYPAATSVVVTAVGGTFGTTGTIRITCFYYNSTAPTSFELGQGFTRFVAFLYPSDIAGPRRGHAPALVG